MRKYKRLYDNLIKKVPNVIGIYISKFDMFKAGKTVYHIDCVAREMGKVQEIHVNTKIDEVNKS